MGGERADVAEALLASDSRVEVEGHRFPIKITGPIEHMGFDAIINAIHGRANAKVTDGVKTLTIYFESPGVDPSGRANLRTHGEIGRGESDGTPPRVAVNNLTMEGIRATK